MAGLSDKEKQLVEHYRDLAVMEFKVSKEQRRLLRYAEGACEGDRRMRLILWGIAAGLSLSALALGILWLLLYSALGELI